MSRLRTIGSTAAILCFVTLASTVFLALVLSAPVFGVVIVGGLLIALARWLYAKRPWRNDYTTFVWWAEDDHLDDPHAPFGDTFPIPVEEAAFDQLFVRKVRVRPLLRRDRQGDAEVVGTPQYAVDLAVRQPWLAFTPEEQRLHDLLMQQLRIWWAKEQARVAS